ncbi:MAG: hypothetical protein LCH79_15240 [Proteobacteria bacterium]|nr:hypothetical protein [Pseudomonadota bacterium]
MAIAVPLLMTATGAGAALGAAIGISGAMATALTTVAFSVTGISDKINKAAASVFGEDLVKIGNIFGAAYGAFGGGFGIGDAAAGTGADAINGMDLASDQFTAAGTGGAGDFGSLAEMAGESMDSMGTLADGAYGGEAALESSQLAGMESMAPSQTLSPMASGGQDLLNAPNGPELAAVEQVQGVQEVAAPTVKAEGAVASQATKAQPAAAAKPIASANQAAAPGQRSFFERLIYDEKGNVSRGAWGALEGVGKGISAASAARDKQKQIDSEMAEQRRRMGMSTGLTVTR